jgi:hypothetical protein
VRGLVVGFLFSWLASGCALVDAAGGASGTDAGSTLDAGADAFVPDLFTEREDIDLLGAEKLAIGDADGDGQDDLVIAGAGPRLFYFSKGNRHELPSPPFTLGALRLVDLNGNGVDDLVARRGNTMLVIPDLAGGGSTPAQLVIPDSGGFTDSFAVGDLNGDGLLDLAAENGARITVFFQSPGGGAVFDSGAQVFLLDQTAEQVGILDVDADGDNDLVSWEPDRLPARVLVLRQNVTPGTFGDPEDLLVIEQTQLDAAIRVTDFNGDGRADLLTFFHDELYVSSATASGPLVDATFTLPGGIESHLLATGDADGDHVPELAYVAFTPFSAEEVRVLQQDRAHRLDVRTFESLELPNASSVPYDIILGDIDGDRRADLVVITDGQGAQERTLAIFHGKP